MLNRKQKKYFKRGIKTGSHAAVRGDCSFERRDSLSLPLMNDDTKEMHVVESF